MRISDWSSDVCSSDLQASLQTPQPHRDHVRSPQGLEAGRYALRQMPQSLLLRHRSRRNRHLLALINEMGWLPPSLTASRCARVFLVQATNGKDGNHEYRYDDWCGSGKVCYTGIRDVDERRDSVSSQGVANRVSKH